MSNQNTYEQSVEALPGEERGMPSVNETGPSTARRGMIVLALFVVVMVAAGVGYLKYAQNAAKSRDAAAQKDLQLTSAVPSRTFAEPPAPPAPPLPTAAPVVPAVAPALPGSGLAPNGKPLPTLDKSGSSLMAPTAHGAEIAPLGAAAPSGAAAAPAGSGDGTLGGSGGIAAMLTSTQTAAKKAGMLGNRNFILAKGSFIDCSLQTRLDSTVPGMTACVITRNIYSDNGKVLLIERGSTVTGEYRSNMRQGMARIFVLWNRIKTPNGVVIPLDSPGTDQLGGAGVPGYIDRHFWERFGGALMLSLVDDVARGVTSSSSSSNSQFNFNSTGDATQNMAAEALSHTINIPPTLYKNQGEQVGIYVGRDLDFSSVYDVTATQ